MPKYLLYRYDAPTPGRKTTHAEVMSLQYELLELTMENGLLKPQKLKEEVISLKRQKIDDEYLDLQKEKIKLAIKLLQLKIEAANKPPYISDAEALLHSLEQ
jgi:hypothetical protein